MASIIFSRKKILKNFSLKECQTKIRQSDSQNTSFFPLTSVQLNNDGFLEQKKSKKIDPSQNKGILQQITKQRIDPKFIIPNRYSKDETNQSSMLYSEINKNSRSQINMSKISKLEESILSSNLSIEHQSNASSTIDEKSYLKRSRQDSILEKVNFQYNDDDTINISAAYSPKSQESQAEKKTKRLILPLIVNYKQYIQERSLTQDKLKSSKRRYETSQSEINKISDTSLISLQNNSRRLLQERKHAQDFLVHNDKIQKKYDNLEDSGNIKSYLLKQPINNSAKLLPVISSNQYYSKEELFKKIKTSPVTHSERTQNSYINNQIKQISRQNKYLIDQYLIQNNQKNELNDKKNQELGKFFSNIEQEKKKEEESVKKLQNAKPKIIEKGLTEAYLKMTEGEKTVLQKIHNRLEQIIKFIDQLNQTGHHKNKNVKLFKKLLLSKKILLGIFMNEKEDDFISPFTIDSFEKNMTIRETHSQNNELIIENKYNLSLFKDIDELVLRIQEYTLEQKLSTIDEIQSRIIQKQRLVLNKAQEMEKKNKIDQSFFAYDCVKKLSSESIAMQQNTDLSTSILEAIKGDHSIPKYFQDENIQFYNKISKSIGMLHRKHIESRKNIFYFK